jgi:hypothetical protein
MIGGVMKKKKIKIVWSCSDHKHHEHKYKFTAYLCGRLQYVFAKLKNGFCVNSVVRRFYLQRGDTVIIFYNGKHYKGMVKGFSSLGMKLYDIHGYVPFNAGMFYGAGYTPGNIRVITVKKLWHYRPAVACEWLRLNLPFNAGRYIFGF